METFFGLAGSTTAALLFFPQVWASFRSKSTKDIAWSGIIIGMLNGFFWIVYGFYKADPFIYVTNIILLFGATLLMFLKAKYK